VRRRWSSTSPFEIAIASQSRHVVNAELVHQPLPVPFDGLHADAEFSGDVLVAAAFGDQLQDLRFSRKVSRDERFLDRNAGDD